VTTSLHCIRPNRRSFASAVLAILAATVLGCASTASASATLLLEEPYGKLGFFTATGHAAVYLSGVCADSPTVLRPCSPGETGVVISRYDGIGRYDWLAIPLVPYLYAVERPAEVPLFADAKMVGFLRDRYRRQYLESVAPDGNEGETPRGNWYELVGSSYDRVIYGYEIATTPEQDLALIRKLNSSLNVSHFRTVSRNCADFAKNIINFYYPKALRRSFVADIGITTPKQLAKRLVKFNQRHPEIQYSRFIIAQVPGSLPRSFAVHGVMESFLKSKKYFVPSAVASPIFAGCLVAVYVGSGAGRFEPARDALVFTPGNVPESPLDHEDLRAYQQQLKYLLAEDYPIGSAMNIDKNWSKLQSKARADFDAHGQPILHVEVDGHVVRLGLSEENLFQRDTPPHLVRQLLEARLQSELRGRSPRALTEAEIDRDWSLLQRTPSAKEPFATHSAVVSEALVGNRR
jgi:hypothetical protein